MRRPNLVAGCKTCGGLYVATPQRSTIDPVVAEWPLRVRDSGGRTASSHSDEVALYLCTGICSTR